jgi:hypothetical protein
MYIYGGYDIREGPMSTMWSFDLNNVGPLADQDLGNSGPSLHWNEVSVQGVKKPGK